MSNEDVRIGLQPGAEAMAFSTGDVDEPHKGAGYVHPPAGTRAFYERLNLDTLPGRTWSSSTTRVTTYTCQPCHRDQFAFFGPRCRKCGAALT